MTWSQVIMRIQEGVKAGLLFCNSKFVTSSVVRLNTAWEYTSDLSSLWYSWNKEKRGSSNIDRKYDKHLCVKPIYLTWYNNRPSPWVRSTSSQNAANRVTSLSPGKPLAKGAGKRYCSFSLTDWNWTSPLSENWCKGREEGNCDTHLINL